MEITIAIMSILGSIAASIITGIISLRIQEKKRIELKDQFVNARLLQQAELEAVEDFTQSGAAQKLSESAVGIVDRYEKQCDRMMIEISTLKTEVTKLKEHRETDKKELERLSLELKVSELHRNHLVEVNNMYIKQMVEANLITAVQSRTIEEIRANNR